MAKLNQQLVLEARTERPYWRVNVKVGDRWRTSAICKQDELANQIALISKAGYATTINVVAITEAAYIRGRTNV